MNRKSHFLSGLAVGYLAVAANFVFTIFSVPIALHYLPTEDFGLWSLVLQITNYLLLLDLGMSSSLARFLADHKDSKDQNAYGDTLQTGRMVLGCQALAVMMLTLVAGLLMHGWLQIPSHLVPAFQRLVWIQGCIAAVGLFLRAFSSPLWAHQRLDITHWATTANLMTALAVLWSGFHFGLGIDSFWVASLGGALWTWLLPWIACCRLDLFPKPSHRGEFQKDLFWRMLMFGRDVLLMQMGGLLCSGSQIILVTKCLGLEAAAVFSVATKTLSMGTQLIGRIVESAAPGLTELFVRGERDYFVARFYQVCTVSLVAAVPLGVALMAGNRDFIWLWTRGTIHWSGLGDLLLAGILIVTVAVRCFQAAYGMSADFSKVRWLGLIEGIIFIILSLLAAPILSLEILLVLALGSQIVASLFPSAFQICKAFPFRDFWNFCPPWTLGSFIFAFLFNYTFNAMAINSTAGLENAAFLALGCFFILLVGLKKQLFGSVAS